VNHHEHQHDPDLAAAWALDALDEDERVRFEARLRTDPEERREADALRETASRLARPVEPSARLRADVLAAVARTPQESVPDAPRRAGVVDLQVRRERRRPSRWSVLVAAAGIVVAAGGVGYGVSAGRDEPAAVTAEQAARQQVADLMAAPGASVQTVAATDGGTATLVVAGDRLGVLTSNLPEVSAGEGYQLWLATGDRVDSAGMLDLTGGTGAGVMDLGTADGFGISVEPAGGSEQPTTTPVVFTPVVAA
jgi:anti-sigma-K factor RskA